MSAFICNESTLQHAAAAVHTYMVGNGGQNYALATMEDQQELLKAVRVYAAPGDDPTPRVDNLSIYDALLRLLAYLNAHAFNQRYGESEMAIPVGRYRGQSMSYKGRPLTIHQAIASLQCLVYQMPGGDVPDHPMYKLLDRIADRLSIRQYSILMQQNGIKTDWDADEHDEEAA